MHKSMQWNSKVEVTFGAPSPSFISSFNPIIGKLVLAVQCNKNHSKQISWDFKELCSMAQNLASTEKKNATLWALALTNLLHIFSLQGSYSTKSKRQLSVNANWRFSREGKSTRSKASEVKPDPYMEGRTIHGWASVPATIHTTQHASTCTSSHGLEK